MCRTRTSLARRISATAPWLVVGGLDASPRQTTLIAAVDAHTDGVLFSRRCVESHAITSAESWPQLRQQQSKQDMCIAPSLPRAVISTESKQEFRQQQVEQDRVQ